MTDIGARVGALLYATEDEVALLGYGVYLGRQPLGEEAVGPWADITRLYPDDNCPGNPAIQLDSGEVVWGCEYWWGPEDAIKARVAAAPRVIETSITEERRKFKENGDD